MQGSVLVFSCKRGSVLIAANRTKVKIDRTKINTIRASYTGFTGRFCFAQFRLAGHRPDSRSVNVKADKASVSLSAS